MYCGGQGIYSYYLTRALARLGHEVHLISGPPYPDKPEGVKLHKIPNPNFFEKGDSAFKELDIKEIFNPLNLYEWAVSRFGNFPEILGFSLRALDEIKRLNKRIGFDVIHDNQCIGYGFLFLRQLGIPMVTTLHHPLKIDREKSINESETFLGKLGSILYYPLIMQRISIRAFDKVITVSEASVKDIEEHFGISKEKVRVIHNGIDEKFFKPTENSQASQAEEINNGQESTFLFVGETENKHKGFRILLQAFEKLLEKHDSCRLRVINGNSPESKYTKKLIQKHNLEDKVDFLGRVSTLRLVEEYSSATAVVMPSLHEGFGLPAIEAMSCGTPLIASTSGALPEIVSSDSGILVPPKNIEKLVNALETIHQKPEKRKRMGTRGRERVKDKFTWNEAAKKVTEVYEEIQNASDH